MRRSSNPLSWLLRNPWYVILAAVFVGFVFWVIGTRTSNHSVQAKFDTAFNLVPGLGVSVDGLEVGKIQKVSYEKDTGKAIVKIGIRDNRYWPLHQGTRAISRFGTTIGSGTRRIDLVPGPSSNPVLPQNGIIPTKDTQAAVDVDQVFDVFNPAQRLAVQGFFKGYDKGLTGHTKNLNDALHVSGRGVSAAGDLFSDLGQDTHSLSDLITRGNRVTGTVAQRAPQLENLVTGAARTFETFAANTKATQDTISELPPTLEQANTTLKRVDSTVDNLDPLVSDLAPGAKRLTPLAKVARPALAQLRQTVPSALGTVNQGTKAFPPTKSLLDTADPFFQNSPTVFNQLAPMVGCIRPYAPELMSGLIGGNSSHASYYNLNLKDDPFVVKFAGPQNPDGTYREHNLRATPMLGFNSLNQPLNSEQFVKVTHQQYAYPRVPGLGVGQPWFIPECGLTKDSLDPSKDPEATNK